MKVFSNEKLIKRNHKLGNILSIGSLLILAVGMYFSFKDKDGSFILLTYSCLIVGFLLFQVGNYFMNRWGKSPRPDELITQSLKGLDDKYSLYHYTTPISHLLIGPAGAFTLLPYSQPGTIKYDPQKKSWRQIGGNFFLKFFGQEGLGRPGSEANLSYQELERYLQKLGTNTDGLKIDSLLVFTNDKAIIEGEGSPVSFVTSAKLKDFIRKKAKENMANTDLINSAIQGKNKS